MTWGWRAHCLSGAAQPEGLQGTRRKAIGCSAKAAGVSATQEGLLPLPNPSTPACLLPSLLQPSASLSLTEQQPGAHLSTEQVARCAPSGERAGLDCLSASAPPVPRVQEPSQQIRVWSGQPTLGHCTHCGIICILPRLQLCLLSLYKPPQNTPRARKRQSSWRGGNSSNREPQSQEAVGVQSSRL